MESATPKPFTCPHCLRTVTEHYHAPTGHDVACLLCVNKSLADFERDVSLTDPKYLAPDKRHATWQDGPWPFTTPFRSENWEKDQYHLTEMAHILGELKDVDHFLWFLRTCCRDCKDECAASNRAKRTTRVPDCSKCAISRDYNLHQGLCSSRESLNSRLFDIISAMLSDRGTRVLGG